MSAKKEIIYTEHKAGEYEDGLQICVLCGEILTDYTGVWMTSDGRPPQGFPEGKIYKAGNETTSIKPEEYYGPDDPYIRTVIKCDFLKS